MVTIRQIAEQCGVSVSTVSKALNDAWDVSGDTAARIRAVAEEMGYTPNAAARALKTRRSYSLGIFYSAGRAQGLTHEFFARILNSFKERSEDLGFDIFFIGGKLGRRTLGLGEHARYRNCDGVLIIVGTDEEAAAASEVAEIGIPTVCIDFGVEKCSCVGSDNIRGMRELTEHVISMGHRRIAYVYGDDSYVTRTRIRSFLDTCREHGLNVPPNSWCRDATTTRPGPRRLPARFWSCACRPPASSIPTIFPAWADTTNWSAEGSSEKSALPDTTASPYVRPFHRS